MRPRQTFLATPPVNLTIHIVAGSESHQDGYLTVSPAAPLGRTLALTRLRSPRKSTSRSR